MKETEIFSFPVEDERIQPTIYRFERRGFSVTKVMVKTNPSTMVKVEHLLITVVMQRLT